MCKLKKDIKFYMISAVILVFAFLPHRLIPNLIDQIDTRYLHILAFGTLTFYMCYIQKIKIKKTFYLLLLFGLFIEITQGLFTTREFSLFDVVFDLIGYGLIVAFLIVKRYFIHYFSSFINSIGISKV